MTKLLHLLILQSMYTGFILSLNFFFFPNKLLYRWELSLQVTSMWSPIGHWEKPLPSFVLRPVVFFTGPAWLAGEGICPEWEVLNLVTHL